MIPLPGSLSVAGNVSARLRLLGAAGIKPAAPTSPLIETARASRPAGNRPRFPVTIECQARRSAYATSPH